ncbi:hypothetical protein AW14_00080 [Siansivirga zeaxanthinifaciens CC-SAMT-1]|uniref:Uncharacterized protein n=1 Tax=Siansivirga zeaxanthinifaciens CC-SAMT-1 TaxID=1454006 RepID=A0A0C5WP57_9FLAO|nr:hypothetical protein AW14_00080 [Siansivirga zeaxanthinifaciens CC-SAMT-1]
MSGAAASSGEPVVGVHNDIAYRTTLPDMLEHPLELFTFIALGRFVSPTKIPYDVIPIGLGIVLTILFLGFKRCIGVRLLLCGYTGINYSIFTVTQ